MWEEVARPRFAESMPLNLVLGLLPLVLYFCRLPGPLAPPVAQMVENLPAIWETWGRPLGREDLPEKEMTTHSSILAWRIPWTEEPGRLPSMGS